MQDFAFAVETYASHATPEQVLADPDTASICFEHGWMATHEVWNILPFFVSLYTDRPVASFLPDVSGFGGSHYRSDQIHPQYYTSEGVEKLMSLFYQAVGMEALSPTQSPTHPEIFVSHSMGPERHGIRPLSILG